jgi:hypothetical protein
VILALTKGIFAKQEKKKQFVYGFLFLKLQQERHLRSQITLAVRSDNLLSTVLKQQAMLRG